MSIKTKHVLGLSGGKDSSALAVHMNNHYPDLDIEYFFTDTGYELKETYDYLIFNHSWEDIYNNILYIKDNERTTKKIRFKCLDMIDFIDSKN